MRERMKVTVKFQNPGTRQLGLLLDEAGRQRQIDSWIAEDYRKMLLLAEQYGVSESPAMWFELALVLARELHPAKGKPGRPTSWSKWNLALLVIEVERKRDSSPRGGSIEWACGELARRDPWKQFVQTVAKGDHHGPDPREALSKRYHEGRSSKAKRELSLMRDVFRQHSHSGTLDEWDGIVRSLLRDPIPDLKK